MSKLFDPSIDLEKRLFYVLSWTAVIANSFGFAANLIFFGMTPATIFCGVCAVVMILCCYAGIWRQRRAQAVTVILSVVNLLEFPLLYYLYGSGRAAYLFLGLIGILVFFRETKNGWMAALLIGYDMVIMILSALYPIPNDTALMSAAAAARADLGAGISTFLIAAVSIAMIITLLIRQYETQNRELEKLTKELREMANLDPLTHLYNRRYLTEYLDRLMNTQGKIFAVALLDMDDFKSVNDRFGHVYGDEVLQIFADSMKTRIAGKGIAARFGGEEFMLVFDHSGRSEIQAVMDEIQTDIEAFSMKTKNVRLSFSGGVEIFHQEDRITKLFNAADEKLYLAKKTGKSRIIFEA